MLNASLARAYDLRLDNDQEMLLIAHDLGFLPKAKSVKSLVLSPGERAEILVNMNEIDNVSLISGSKRGLYDKMKNMLISSDELADNTVLELRTKGGMSAFNKQPTSLSKRMRQQCYNKPLPKLENLILMSQTV